MESGITPLPRGHHNAAVIYQRTLSQLLAALAVESKLTGFGHLSLRWDLKRLLRNAAYIEQLAFQDPIDNDATLKAPIFILGLPRSGTTFLHELLAEDSSNLVPRVWQMIIPKPRPSGFQAEADAHARAVNRQLRMFSGFSPEFSHLHPIHADSPQECSEITAHVFQSLRFDTTFRIPSYLKWLDTVGDDDAFAFHRKFLWYLQQGTSGQRWVLKCPDHSFSIPAILKTYPDARFVVVHRDPMDVLASVAHLTEILRKPFLMNNDPGEIGQQVAGRWIDGANRLVAFDRANKVPGSRKINIRYDDLVARPMETIERIYTHFGTVLAAEAYVSIGTAIKAKPAGGYSRRPGYLADRVGIRGDKLQDGFQIYRDHFGIAAA